MVDLYWDLMIKRGGDISEHGSSNWVWKWGNSLPGIESHYWHFCGLNDVLKGSPWTLFQIQQ